MIILPAIDLKDGKCVRLFQGDYATAEQVAEDPVKTAQSFEEQGARWVHLVDLDGAKARRPVNDSTVFSIRDNVSMNIEVGGGIRDMDTVEYYLSHGINRIILGSAALHSPEFVRGWTVERYQVDLSKAARINEEDMDSQLRSMCSREVPGEPNSETHIERTAVFGAHALYRLQPVTGRRHQLRRHLKHIAHPIVGDATFGKGRHNRFFQQQFDCHRMLLHCARLQLVHPHLGTPLRLVAAPDGAFAAVLDALHWRAALPDWLGPI